MIEQTGQNPAFEPAPAEFSVNVFSDQRLSFEILLEDICERLQDTRQQGSLKRIRKLEEILDLLEQELNKLIQINSGQE